MTSTSYANAPKSFPMRLIIAASIALVTADAISMTSHKLTVSGNLMDVIMQMFGPTYVPKMFFCSTDTGSMTSIGNHQCPPGRVSGPEAMFFLKIYMSLGFSLILIGHAAARIINHNYFYEYTWDAYEKKGYKVFRKESLKAVIIMSILLPASIFFMAKEARASVNFNVIQMIIQDSLSIGTIIVLPGSTLIIFVLLFRSAEVSARLDR